MGKIELAGRRIGGDIGIGAGHLLLILTDDLGAEFVLSAYTDNNLFSGNLYVETHEGSAWVPAALSTEASIDPDLFDRVEVDFAGRDPEAVAEILNQHAFNLNGEDLSYSALNQNSNSVIGSLLDLVGIDVDDFLPNPPDVGFLGFVSRDELITFDYALEGSDDGDLIRGRGNVQHLQGLGGNDTLSAGDGDDALVGGQGDDLLDGGSGTDTAFFSGAQSSYTLILSSGHAMVADRRTDGNGTDTLTAIELLDFETDLLGQPFDLRVFGGMASLDPQDIDDLIELYIAYFNRAPDALGLNFWGTAMANGLSRPDMAALFVDQPETTGLYPPEMTDEAFASAVYANVLGRTPDEAGTSFWAGLLETGVLTRNQFILEVLDGARSDLKPELGQAFVDQQRADRDYLDAKTGIGSVFAVDRGLSDVDDAAAVMAMFDGTEMGIAAALAAIEGHYAVARDPVSGEFLMPLLGVHDDPMGIA